MTIFCLNVRTTHFLLVSDKFDELKIDPLCHCVLRHYIFIYVIFNGSIAMERLQWPDMTAIPSTTLKNTGTLELNLIRFGYTMQFNCVECPTGIDDMKRKATAYVWILAIQVQVSAASARFVESVRSRINCNCNPTTIRLSFPPFKSLALVCFTLILGPHFNWPCPLVVDIQWGRVCCCCYLR